MSILLHSIVQTITPFLEENKLFFEFLHYLYLSEWIISRGIKLKKWVLKKLIILSIK
jgi:hypothetical protein